MTVKLLNEHRYEFLRLKVGCTDLSESTHVKMPHCWKSHDMGHMVLPWTLSSAGALNEVISPVSEPEYWTWVVDVFVPAPIFRRLREEGFSTVTVTGVLPSQPWKMSGKHILNQRCSHNRLICRMLLCLFDFLLPINNLSVKQGRVFLGWTSTKLG